MILRRLCSSTSCSPSSTPTVFTHLRKTRSMPEGKTAGQPVRSHASRSAQHRVGSIMAWKRGRFFSGSSRSGQAADTWARTLVLSRRCVRHSQARACWATRVWCCRRRWMATSRSGTTWGGLFRSRRCACRWGAPCWVHAAHFACAHHFSCSPPQPYCEQHMQHLQTLYGHGSTVTGVFTYGQHVLSCSTDRTIRAWKRIEGRQNLKYPWFEQEVRHHARMQGRGMCGHHTATICNLRAHMHTRMRAHARTHWIQTVKRMEMSILKIPFPPKKHPKLYDPLTQNPTFLFFHVSGDGLAAHTISNIRTLRLSQPCLSQCAVAQVDSWVC